MFSLVRDFAQTIFLSQYDLKFLLLKQPIPRASVEPILRAVVEPILRASVESNQVGSQRP